MLVNCSMVFILLSLILVAEAKPGLVDLIFKKCNTDSDCAQDECCSTLLFNGKRCRSFISEGTICQTFSEDVLKRYHSRCPCESGTHCSSAQSILGLYKVYKCTKLNS
nr:U9-ctenitoxin-Pr1a [Hydra vulgaris]